MVADLLLIDEELQWEFKEVPQTLQQTSTSRDGGGQPKECDNVVGQLYTAGWWKETAILAASKGCKLLSIILYTDGIVVDWAGKIKLTPIMMTLGNFDLQAQRSLRCKRLLGFVPHVSAADYINLFGNDKVDTAEMNRLVTHSCLGWCVLLATCTKFVYFNLQGSFKR